MFYNTLINITIIFTTHLQSVLILPVGCLQHTCNLFYVVHPTHLSIAASQKSNPSCRVQGALFTPCVGLLISTRRMDKVAPPRISFLLYENLSHCPNIWVFWTYPSARRNFNQYAALQSPGQIHCASSSSTIKIKLWRGKQARITGYLLLGILQCRHFVIRYFVMQAFCNVGILLCRHFVMQAFCYQAFCYQAFCYQAFCY